MEPYDLSEALIREISQNPDIDIESARVIDVLRKEIEDLLDLHERDSLVEIISEDILSVTEDNEVIRWYVIFRLLESLKNEEYTDNSLWNSWFERYKDTQRLSLFIREIKKDFRAPSFYKKLKSKKQTSLIPYYDGDYWFKKLDARNEVMKRLHAKLWDRFIDVFTKSIIGWDQYLPYIENKFKLKKWFDIFLTVKYKSKKLKWKYIDNLQEVHHFNYNGLGKTFDDFIDFFEEYLLATKYYDREYIDISFQYLDWESTEDNGRREEYIEVWHNLEFFWAIMSGACGFNDEEEILIQQFLEWEEGLNFNSDNNILVDITDANWVVMDLFTLSILEYTTVSERISVLKEIIKDYNPFIYNINISKH